MMTLVTRIGPEHQKGVITGIFRSLGALARACGPIVASSGKKTSSEGRNSKKFKRKNSSFFMIYYVSECRTFLFQHFGASEVL